MDGRETRTASRPRRQQRRARLAAAVVLVGAMIAPGASSPSTVLAAAPSRFVTGWIPYWEMDDYDGSIGVNAAPAVFADAAIFDFEATGATTITLEGGETLYNRALTALRSKGIVTYAAVVDHMGKLGMAGVLADDASRAAHVQALVDLAVARKVDGLDIDYENFAFTDGQSSWATTRPNWVKFVNELGAALHAQGKLLAVTVPAIWDGGTRGYTVYDWAGIIDAVDRLRIMVYDWSFSSAGPNAPMSWVNSVINYTKATIPGSIGKVQLGVPTYGYSYAQVQSGQCPDNAQLGKLAVQTESAATLAATNNATPVRHESGEMTFSYEVTYTGTSSQAANPPGWTPPTSISPKVDAADQTGLKAAVRVRQPSGVTSCVVKRVVFYPDTESVVQRARAALSAGMAGIAIWALGYESPDLWPALSAIDAANPNAFLGTTTLGSLDAATVHPGGVEVTGWALDPEVDVPVDVQVAVNGGEWSGPLVARDPRADVAESFTAAGAEVGDGHGFSLVVPIETQPGDTVCVRASGWGDDAAPREIGCVTAASAPGPAAP